MNRALTTLPTALGTFAALAVALAPAAGAETAPNGYPYCVNGTAGDPDGDGWGWENNRSCVVHGSGADSSGGGSTS
jgi:hypothetical protein